MEKLVRRSRKRAVIREEGGRKEPNTKSGSMIRGNGCMGQQKRRGWKIYKKGELSKPQQLRGGGISKPTASRKKGRGGERRIGPPCI